MEGLGWKQGEGRNSRLPVQPRQMGDCCFWVESGERDNPFPVKRSDRRFLFFTYLASSPAFYAITCVNGLGQEFENV